MCLPPCVCLIVLTSSPPLVVFVPALLQEYREHPIPLILQVFGVFLALSVYSYLLNVAIVLVTKLVEC